MSVVTAVLMVLSKRFEHVEHISEAGCVTGGHTQLHPLNIPQLLSLDPGTKVRSFLVEGIQVLDALRTLMEIPPWTAWDLLNVRGLFHWVHRKNRKVPQQILTKPA